MYEGGPTYAEARSWIVWLHTFTASDLAQAMAINEEVAERFIKAALWHGIILDTEDRTNGGGPVEAIYTYAPLPPGPTHHPHGTPPEVIAVMQMGGPIIYDVRGLPVRLVDNTKRRDQMQRTKGARLRIKRRDAAYEAMQQAKMERAESDRQKRIRLASEGRLPVRKKKTKSIKEVWPEPSM